MAVGEKCYRDVAGLEDAPEKRVRYAEDFKLWGTEVKGQAGTVAAPVERRSELIVLLTMTVSQRVIDKKTLKRLTTLRVHPFQHARAFMSVLQDTYGFLNSMEHERFDVIVFIPMASKYP